MSLILQATKSALRPGLTSSFAASGGTAPYTYTIAPSATPAGGTIDPMSGLYTAPSTVPMDSRNYYDTVLVTDSLAKTATQTILVGHSWMLIADIFKHDLGLPLERIYFWDVKENMPEDDGMFLVLALSRSKPLASNIIPVGQTSPNDGPGWDQAQSWTQVNSTIDIHVYSRGLDAINRLSEVFVALVGPYSKTQQQANGFYLSKIPHNAVDVSGIDGAAIPYHYVVSLESIYTQRKVFAPDYYDTFQIPPQILVNN